MTNELACITHHIDGIAPCVHRDVHYADCKKGTVCPRGCAPRLAKHGYVCEPCWKRLEGALAEWDQFHAAFANEIRAVQPEPGNGARPKPTIPLSPLQLAIDALLRFQRSRPGAARYWVTTPAGAEDAVRFTRAMESAARAFPRVEGASKIPTTRCPKCRRRSLVYDPAQHEGGEAMVRCLSADCNNVMDHDSFAVISLIEAQCCRRCRTSEACANTDCGCHKFAPVPEWQRTAKGEFEPYDPTNPDHVALVGV